MPDPVVEAEALDPKFGMGLLPSRNKSRFRAFAAAYPVILRDQWKPISFKHLGVPILNQGTFGSCTGHGTCTACWNAWNLSGQTRHDFSPTWVYANINGGRDGGASIDDALQVVTEKGICFMSQCPESMIYMRQIPPEASLTALRFRFEGYTCNTVDELASGLQLGFFPVYGVTVGAAFQNYNGKGLVRQGMGPPNHCVTANGMKLVNGIWVFDLVNSWDVVWGNQGCGQIAIDTLPPDEMFLIRFGHSDPLEPNQGPIAA